jgi:hypothetical protein
MHVRSLDADAAAFMNMPMGHVPLTTWHAEASSTLENVPAAHGLHTASVVEEPAAVRPSPGGQVLQETHSSLPAVVLNVPSAHGAHVRSLEAVGATFMK